MNERLEKEWKSYCAKQGSGTMISVNVKDVAQHFYNLALSDVDKHVESLTTNAHEMPDNHPEKTYCIGVDDTVQQVLDFIDRLSK